MKITLNVNGQQHMVAVDPETPLLFVLNDEHVRKRGRPRRSHDAGGLGHA